MFPDGTPVRDAILSENGNGYSVRSFFKRLRERYEHREVLPDGRVFKRVAVSLAFVPYRALEREEDDDPFADENRVDNLKKSRADRWVVTPSDPRILREPGDRIYNLQELFEGRGIRFGENDFAVINRNRSVLTVLAEADEMEMVERIVQMSEAVEPSSLVIEVRLLEAESKIELQDVLDGEVKTLGVGYTSRPYGGSSMTRLGKGEHRFKMSTEAQNLEHEQVVNLELEIQFLNGEFVQNKTLISKALKRGGPSLLNQQQVDGKWRALWVKCSRRYHAEMLPKQK